MNDTYQVYPIGRVRKQAESITLEIKKEYTAALSGLDQFSHIYVFYWFHQNDSADKRKTLEVHPRGNRQNPLTGVFATHSPVRPNLVAMSLCKIISIDDNIIKIDKIDAFDNTPLIDIKCYIPASDENPAINFPEWV